MKKSIVLVSLLLIFCGTSFSIAATPVSVTLAGNLQSQLGCPDNWQPDCAVTHLEKNGTEWTFSAMLPAGAWEYKIALNDAWTESYGYNLSSENAKFTIASEKTITFKYDDVTHLVTDTSQEGVAVDPQPASVTIAGNLQKVLGCIDDWAPSCTATQLEWDGADKVWQKSFIVPAGDWQYKAALNSSWAENYGAAAKPNGNNIGFSLTAPKNIKFYYSNKNHFVADSHTSVIATAAGNFQAALGCPANWQPDCLRSWMQDVNASGLYVFSTTAIPIGDYNAKVALNESWEESYGSDTGSDIGFKVSTDGQKVFFTYDAVNHKVYIGDEVVSGNLKTAKAHWLTRDTIAIDLPAAVAATANLKLHYSPTGSLASSPAGIVGGDSIALTYNPAGLSDSIKAKFKHLSGFASYKIAAADLTKLPEILKQQIAVSATATNGKLLDATALQFAGVLDDLFSYSGALGVTYNGAIPSVSLWAPTAKSVKLHIYDAAVGSESSVIEMVGDSATGVWAAAGSVDWNRKYYLYEVEVFVRSTGRIEHNWVTDPYSLGVSTNGKRSLLVNLNDADLKPDAWDSLSKPIVNAPEDAVIYELHVRDFSIADTSVAENKRGTFAAFTDSNSKGMTHLKGLADAGLTHIHLLPVYDCATVNEIKSEQKMLMEDLSIMAPDSESQQAAVNTIRGQDGFNWCYDPFHYTVPDGSYATDPEGVTRIKEFRAMVASLSKAGLRVVMDVVYNHTSASGLSDTSVLDKVVPNYYHRLNASGDVENSTCCANTASENAMMEKLMLDSVRIWATQYKVDGFRYDIMGHHTKQNIVNIKSNIQALTLAENGVDGRNIYFYGEGWNFGEVKDNARFEQATIGNMSGTGVGTFNDRIRDAVRGGGCCDSGMDLIKNQSFITGLYTAPNAENSADANALASLLKAEDKLKVVLAGSLADFSFMDRNDFLTKASALDGTGYTQDPSETINYIEAHDNETLFDIIQYKAPLDTSMADRVRMQNLGNSIVLLAQGIPFLHAGQDMLRSKSFDRNSYDAGDWFNALDFSYQKNGWGKGLPLAQDNQASWGMMKPRLAMSALMPSAADITRAREATTDLLKIRKSSKLFRLETAEQIRSQVSFYNTGSSQVPGLVVMEIKDSEANLDPDLENVLVFFNANSTSKTIRIDDLKGWDFQLHRVQKQSTDSMVKQSTSNKTTGTFSVPGRTTAVFVAAKKKGDVGGGSHCSRSKKGCGSMTGWWDLLLCFCAAGLLLSKRRAA